MRVTLGFDTSCYTTSAAAVGKNGEVVASSRMLLPVAGGERGLRQSEAVFAHVRQMPQVMARLALPPDAEIAAVCASATPRNEKDSYMPVFAVGLGHARVVAQTLRVPLYETSHQQGHIAAGLIGNARPERAFIALHLSGGTTELLLVQKDGLRLMGGSLEKLALACREPTQALLPVSLEKDGLHCHLSGVESQAQRWIQSGGLNPELVAAEVFDVLARTVARLLNNACRQTGAKTALVVGGVASSTLLRALLVQRMQKLRSPAALLFGQPQYSADNAAGVAAIGMRRFMEENG